MCMMPIEALPQTTIRAIGSTSVISDAYSVVKELIDNALDASASSLQIEISQNTVDVIQLKDNGYGISLEDQKLVCKRAFTSKIQTLDDLKKVGGSSLGFRGEALASVAEMCGVISVTTRVKSEVVGQCMKYGRGGEVTGAQRISHPVGTTVRVTDFLKHIPVRKQSTLKSAAKTLARIKRLLQSYAISQPSKRLSLKVLKATNENNNWSYAPSADPSFLDAALKVVGREISSSCVLRRLSSEGASGKENESLDREEYEAVAFLPNTQFETSKINNAGQYISVDGRPLSTSRGIAHEIAKIFKQYVRVAASKSETSKSISDPFMCLHILCPRGTYDVNVEPAKDDVLFEDRDLVLNLINGLFREYYGELDGAAKSLPKQIKETASSCDQVSAGFELLMARKPATQLPRDPATPFRDDIPNKSISQRSLHSENDILPVEISSSEALENSGQADTTKTKRSSFVNPWSISRINASFQTPRSEKILLNNSSPVGLSSGSLQGSMGKETEPRSLQHSPNTTNLPSPPTSRLTFGSPVRHRRQQVKGSLDSSPESRRMSSGRRAERERARERYGNGALDTGFQKTTQTSLQQTPVEHIPSQDPSEDLSELSLSSLAQERFGSPAIASHEGGHDDERSSACSEAHSMGGSPLEPAQLDTFLSNNQDAEAPVSMDSGRGFPVLERWAAQLHGDNNHEEPTDLERALDFEKRKKEAIQNKRLQLKNRERPLSSHPTQISKPTHSSRYLAAKAALTSSQSSVGEPVSAIKISSHDSRAYLMRQQEVSSVDETSANDAKGRRPLTSRLPFERIPDGSNLHDVGTTCQVDLSPESEIFRTHTWEDLYIQTGDEATAFSSSDMEECMPLWNERLAIILKQQYQSKDTSLSPSSKIDLSSIISQHLRDFDEK